MAKRVQLKRTKGFKLPDGARSVARPSCFGNPFKIQEAMDYLNLSRDKAVGFCVAEYRKWLLGDRNMWQGADSDAAASIINRRLPELRGKDLACYCPLDQPCHADVLLELANPNPK